MKGPLGRLRRRYENNIKMNLINRKGNRGLDIHVCLCLCVCVCVCLCNLIDRWQALGTAVKSGHTLIPALHTNCLLLKQYPIPWDPLVG